MCDMCGHEIAGPMKGESIPEDAFEFVVNLADGARTIQICPSCQAKLRKALEDKSNSLYNIKFCGCGERSTKK